MYCWTRTICLAGKTAAERKGSADVLPVRQRNCSKIDYCYCPRRQPLLLRRANFSHARCRKSTRFAPRVKSRANAATAPPDGALGAIGLNASLRTVNPLRGTVGRGPNHRVASASSLRAVAALLTFCFVLSGTSAGGSASYAAWTCERRLRRCHPQSTCPPDTSRARYARLRACAASPARMRSSRSLASVSTHIGALCSCTS
ncbi:hypothetical protein C7399_102176 [Paraburkholderia tropica]|uniref:Uncharacterized protein n=1 Tax=Paraburkholderia tropica TaxID=92647 RepID=A0ABX5N0Y8_9BURK|nr:hypothetical protein C7400_102176 [Paraburkholderia tropica]PZW88692.1 hypothetical protein C7399_102176 [Paraburkholderia tropica]